MGLALRCSYTSFEGGMWHYTSSSCCSAFRVRFMCVFLRLRLVRFVRVWCAFGAFPFRVRLARLFLVPAAYSIALEKGLWRPA